MDEFNLIGAKITTIRFNKKITSEELAERCGFTLKMVEKMESGEVIPSLGHLIKVARALGFGWALFWMILLSWDLLYPGRIIILQGLVFLLLTTKKIPLFTFSL